MIEPNANAQFHSILEAFECARNSNEIPRNTRANNITIRGRYKAGSVKAGSFDYAFFTSTQLPFFAESKIASRIS